MSAYLALALLHRPDDPRQIAAEVVRLHNAVGWTARDIASALRLDHVSVIRILSSAAGGRFSPLPTRSP
jgi:hypothetical protein